MFGVEASVTQLKLLDQIYCVYSAFWRTKENFDYELEIAVKFLIKERLICKCFFFLLVKKKASLPSSQVLWKQIIIWIFPEGKIYMISFVGVSFGLRLMGGFDPHVEIFFPVIYNYFHFLFLKVRVDSGIQQGSDISIYYDPMISKVSWSLFLNILKVWSIDFLRRSFMRESILKDW